MQLLTFDEVREFECRELALSRNIGSEHEMLLEYNEH